MTSNTIKETGKLEIGGRIGFIDPIKDIDSLIGKNLTLSMEDNQFLRLKSGVYGTIIEAEFLQ